MARAYVDPETAEPQTLDEILHWHGGIVDALREQLASVQNAIRRGSAVSPRFATMTEAEVELVHDAQRLELDRLTVFNLVASVEAAIRIDYFRRVSRKLRDPLALVYRRWNKTLSKKKKKRPNFDQGGILEILKNSNLIDNNLIGRYRECLKARHWVGHGRYWARPDAEDGLDPSIVYIRAHALLRALPNR